MNKSDDAGRPPGRLQGKSALVTGAASGFGLAIARRFLMEGAQVVLGDIDLNAARAAADSIAAAGGRASAHYVDVTSGTSMKALVDATLSAHGRLDIVVNNAGAGGTYGDAEQTPETTFDKIFTVNMKSLYWSVVHATGPLRASGAGVMLNIASASAIRPRAGLVWYSASKAAVTTATKALALELAKDNVRVCALCPVAAHTPMMVAALGETTPETEKQRMLASLAATIPLGRLCRPDDVASAALHLASDEAGFLTGVALEVDGGRCV